MTLGLYSELAERHAGSPMLAVPPQPYHISESTTSPHFRPLDACRCYRAKNQDKDTHLDGPSRISGTMQSLSFSRFVFTAALVLFFAVTRLDAKYLSVDDGDTSWVLYSPDSGWKVGNNCNNCSAMLDRTQVYYGTWHE
jgi:hypothetical protein